MTHYERRYAGEADADVSAIRDIHEYLSERQWNVIIAAAHNRDENCPKALDFCLCFMGVQGFPNHAFIRVFRPEQYDEWYAGLPE
jgi:hypothetical protein